MLGMRSRWWLALSSLWVWGMVGSAYAQPSAEDLLRLGQLDAAMREASQDARDRPSDMAAQELYIDLLLSMGLAGRASKYCDERRRVAPSDPDAHYLVGRSARTADGAQQAYEAALRLDPDHARSFMGMAAVHSASGRRDAAVTGYARSVQLDPSLSEAWLGWIREASHDDRAEALAIAEKAKLAVPREPGVYLWLGLLDPEDVLETLAEGLKHEPLDARLHATQAERLLEAGRTEEAGQAAEEALHIERHNPTALRVQLYAKEIDSSRLDVAGYRMIQERMGATPDPSRWSVLVERYPTSALVWIGRANARRAMNDLPGHDQDLHRAVGVDESNVEAQAAWGLRLLALGQPKTAWTHLEAASRTRPWDVSVGLALAQAVGQSGDKDEEGALLTVLAERHTMDVRVARVRAQWLLDQTQYEEAYRYVRETLQRLPDGQLGVALVASALQTGRHQEAASLVEAIGHEVGNARLIEAARQLRAAGSGG
jgi:tetratricopeptide (TPR) repeat protein